MRYRERNNLQALPMTYNGTEKATNGSVTSITATLKFPCSTGTFESIADVEIPNFHERSMNGEVFVNPMTKIVMKQDIKLSSLSYTIAKLSGQNNDFSQNFGKHPGYLGSYPPLGYAPGSTASDYPGLLKEAGTQAAAGVDAPAFAGATFLAELSETVSFLRNPLEAWKDHLVQTRKRKNKSGFNRAKTVGNFIAAAWLTERYALRPLVSDIQDAWVAIDAKLQEQEVKAQRRTSRGYASASGDTSDTTYPAANGGGHYTVDSSSSWKVSVRTGLYYEIYHGINYAGVRPRDIPAAMWEGVRYSFVFDWFANIGPWLLAITPVQGVRELGSWTTVKEEVTLKRSTRWTAGGTVANPTRERKIGSDGATMESLNSVYTHREPGLNVGLTWRASPLTGDFGVGRCTDLLAMGSQILRNR